MRRVATRAAAGDVVSVILPVGAVRAEMGAEAVALGILHEDDDLVVLDKPAGVVVHPTHAHGTGTLMNALLWHARGWPAGHRPSLVGRLDKLTSGLVLVAKTASIHRALQHTMASAGSDKDYLAIVYGRVEPPGGDIDLRLARDQSDRRRVVASPDTGARSLTEFERLALAPAAEPEPPALPPADRPHSPDPRAPGRPRLADRRRPGLWRAALVGHRRSGAGGAAAGIPAAGAARLAAWFRSPGQRCASVD